MAALIDRIHHSLVGLKMPRAIETLQDIVRRIERGEIGALDAIDTLLAEELAFRESRRIGVAAVKAGKSVYRATFAELIQALAKAQREDRLADKIRLYARSALLIVDEIVY